MARSGSRRHDHGPQRRPLGPSHCRRDPSCDTVGLIRAAIRQAVEEVAAEEFARFTLPRFTEGKVAGVHTRAKVASFGTSRDRSARRDAPEHHRPRTPALRAGDRWQALVCRPRPDREPPRPDRGCPMITPTHHGYVGGSRKANTHHWPQRPLILSALRI